MDFPDGLSKRCEKEKMSHGPVMSMAIQRRPSLFGTSTSRTVSSEWWFFFTKWWANWATRWGGWDPTSFCFEGVFFWVCAWNSWKSRSQWCWVGDWAESITRNIVDFFRLFGPNLTFRENCSITQSYTPWKINIEHNNGGLEDDFPFQRGGFCGYCIYMLIFRGVGGGLIVFSLLCVDIIQFDGRISFQNGLVQPPTSSGHRILQKKQGAATPTHHSIAK